MWVADSVEPDSTACQSDHSLTIPTAFAQCEGFRFPRKARLLTAADYASVFKKNQRFSDRYWTVLVSADNYLPARLGLAIAKKRARRAVDRNKIKRVARESFRAHQRHLNGLQLVVMNRDAAASETSLALRRSMDSLCRRIIARYKTR